MYVHKLAPPPELGGGSVRQSQWQTNCCEGCFHSHLNAVAVIVAVVSNPRRNLGVSPIRPDHCSQEYTGKRYPTSRWRLSASPFPCPNLLQFKCQFLSSASCSDQPFPGMVQSCGLKAPSTHKQPPTPDQVEEKRGEAPPESKSPCRYPVPRNKENMAKQKAPSCPGLRTNSRAFFRSHAMYLKQNKHK
jgi:hypothetical protein